MKKIISILSIFVLLLIVPSVSLARLQTYIVADSDTREMTWNEMWSWDYESLGYIFNEILARHGFDFIPGGKYDVFFSDKAWYEPNESFDGNDTCYNRVSSLEYKNIRLAKSVRLEMRSMGTYNTGARSIWDLNFETKQYLSSFSLLSIKAGQKLPVFSGPGEYYQRGAKGKAVCSTNGNVYGCGYENGWLMIMYETNNGSVRVGYTPGNFYGNVSLPSLRFAYENTRLTKNANLTSDPVKIRSSICNLPRGTSVTYLSTFNAKTGTYAHIETTLPNGQLARGFVPLDSVDTAVYYAEENISFK